MPKHTRLLLGQKSRRKNCFLGFNFLENMSEIFFFLTAFFSLFMPKFEQELFSNLIWAIFLCVLALRRLIFIFFTSFLWKVFFLSIHEPEDWTRKQRKYFFGEFFSLNRINEAQFAYYFDIRWSGFWFLKENTWRGFELEGESFGGNHASWAVRLRWKWRKILSMNFCCVGFWWK